MSHTWPGLAPLYRSCSTSKATYRSRQNHLSHACPSRVWEPKGQQASPGLHPDLGKFSGPFRSCLKWLPWSSVPAVHSGCKGRKGTHRTAALVSSSGGLNPQALRTILDTRQAPLPLPSPWPGPFIPPQSPSFQSALPEAPELF
jgi:hypothetical protein